MESTKRIILIAVVMLFSVSNCGKKGNSALITIAVVPDEPIVINADFEEGDEVCSAPWYRFSLRIENNSEKTLVVVAAKGKAQGTKNNAPVELETSIVATEFNPFFPNLVVLGPGEEILAEGLEQCGLPDTDDLTYSVEEEYIGWFGTGSQAESEPEERFSKVISYQAR